MSDSVVIVPSDPSWAIAFEHARSDLLVALGGRVTEIEHIGSTAVPGLAAKPVIDLLCGVASLDEVAAFVPILAARGWEYPLDLNREIVSRHFFLRRNDQGVRTHHAHFVVRGGPLWAEYILFRDRLRASAELRKRYETLKRDLADKFHDQRERYTASKTDFVKEVLALGEDEQPVSRG
ncbi:MAG TPA: GrpB family protein [Polyangiaceae bacterium]|jgi:GrpB-like predicted nucleotidyltransferase (UPF0157 family)